MGNDLSRLGNYFGTDAIRWFAHAAQEENRFAAFCVRRWLWSTVEAQRKGSFKRERRGS